MRVGSERNRRTNVTQAGKSTVLRPNGDPANEVLVLVRGGDVICASTKTDDQGRFRCIVEPAEQYWIEVELSRSGEALLRGKSEPFAPAAGAQTVHLNP